MKTRLRWKRQARETGLRAVGASERGWEYHDGERWFAIVAPNGGGWRSTQNGWYWYASVGDDTYNSLSHTEIFQDPNEAKAAAVAWLKSRIEVSQ